MIRNFNFKKYNLFLVLTFFSVNIFGQNDNWALKKQENGISVYSRQAENSELKELKSVQVVKTSLSGIVSLLNDFESYPEWVYKCGKSTTYKRINETEVIHYQTVVAPWPADNRDFVVDVKLTQDSLTKIVVIRADCKPDMIPEVKDHVRIKLFKASWTLKPLKNGSVEVTYQLLVDPGGFVPAWIINLAVVDGPYETSLKLKDWVKKEKYQKAQVSYIKE
jgi:ribosome-associated toxin RatA of RatAB toxin-antitoxin module